MLQRKVIELGGGQHPKLHPNVDCRNGEGVDIVADLEKSLPLPSNEYEYVYSAFAIEHLSWRAVKGFIAEIYRILKAGGQVMVIAPNLLEQCRKIVCRPVDENNNDWDENFSCMIFGDQNYSENTHKNGMSPRYAKKLFEEAGFAKVSVSPYPNCETDMVILAIKGE